MEDRRERALTPPPRWPIAELPLSLVVYFVLVDGLTLIWSGAALRGLDPTDGRAWAVCALLSGLALLFEEGATRTARLQRRLSGQLKRNMTSVWTVAAAVALPTAQAVILTVAVVVYIWFRQQRPVGQQLYKGWYTASTQILACLVSEAALGVTEPHWHHVGWALAGTISVLLVITVQALVNRVLITLALVWMGVRGTVLLGSRDDNLIELATLCLGGLVALAAAHEPWLSVLVIAPMITLQRGALVRELETAATIDAKTGLLNAVAWEQLAKRELEHARRDATPLAVLIIDIDRFKLVNDNYGHLVGDEVLGAVGRCLSSEVREYDTVGRFGGEEFVVVLPSANESDALVIAERLRSKINDLRISALVDRVVPESGDQLAVSIGVSCAPFHGDELADLLVCADAALYRAKAGGRNRVVLADTGDGNAFERIVRR